MQVISQFLEDESIGYQGGLLALCALARKVLTWQPGRRFLHCVYIRQSQVELGAMDRSGIYCYDAFNIQHDFARFISLIARYRLTTDKDLGASEITDKDQKGCFIKLEDSACNSVGVRKLFWTKHLFRYLTT